MSAFSVYRLAISLISLGLLLVCLGCSGEKEPSTEMDPDKGEVSVIPVMSGMAVLDWSVAQINLPLSEYSMSSTEVRIVEAAQQIVFAQCVTGNMVIAPITIDAARSTLALEASMPMWLYGFWNADFIAQHGWSHSANQVEMGQGLSVDSDTGVRCASNQDYIDLAPITVSYVSNDSVANQLVAYSMEAYNRAVADSRFVTLDEQRSKCVTALGYEVRESVDYNSVYLEPTWSLEKQVKAALAEAQCSDDMSFTQQAGDIEAAYEQEIIERNQAELVTIKSLVEQRVSRARIVLYNVGLV